MKVIKKIKSNINYIFLSIKIVKMSDKMLLLLMIVFSILAGCIPFLLMLLSQNLLNVLQLKEDFNIVISAIIYYVLFSIVEVLINNINTYIQEKMQMKIAYNLNYMLMEKCSKLTLENFEDSEIYNKITRLEGEVTFKPFQVLQSLVSIVSALFSTIVAVLIILRWKPQIVPILLLLLFINIFYYLKIGKEEFNVQYAMSGEERKAWYYSYLMTHDLAFKEINMFGLKRFFLPNFLKIKKNLFSKRMHVKKKKAVFTSFFNIIQEMLVAIVIYIAAKAAYLGEILIGNVTTYIKTVTLLQSNSTSLLNGIYSLYNSNLYMKLFFEFLDIPEKEATGLKINEIKKIEFRNVSFGYKQKVDVLHNINLVIEKGDTIAIIGKNGSGKSSLLKILCGLYTINKGTILINDTDIREIDIKNYKENISVLFQDFIKYEMKLNENIFMGDLNQKDNKQAIVDALKKVDEKLLYNIASPEEGINTQLGNWFDDGRQLSGGQWQKIALARTYFRKRDVYLLDEPSASLDSEAEVQVFDSFTNICKGKIGVFITHKVAAAKKASKIIVLDQGKIVGIGDDAELYRNCPVYKELKDDERYEYE